MAYRERINVNVSDNKIGKYILFRPDEIDDMNWKAGCHDARITGNVRILNADKIFVLHLNKNFGAEYLIEKYRLLKERQSQKNQRRGYCIHYRKSPDEIRQEYKRRWDNAFNFLEMVES